MEPQREGLSQEVQAMEPEERTRSLGVVWQYAGRGRGKTDRWHEFSPVDGAKVEQAHQQWEASGKPKEHDKCRVEMTLESGLPLGLREFYPGGMVLSLDFHLGTQITVGRASQWKQR